MLLCTFSALPVLCADFRLTHKFVLSWCDNKCSLSALAALIIQDKTFNDDSAAEYSSPTLTRQIKNLPVLNEKSSFFTLTH